MQADMVIMTNDSPLGEAPNEIIADMVAGYPDHILKRNASMPYQPGFLQDPRARGVRCPGIPLAQLLRVSRAHSTVFSSQRQGYRMHSQLRCLTCGFGGAVES